MPFAGSMGFALIMNGLPVKPPAPSSVSFSTFGGTFGNFTVASVATAVTYKVKVYQTTTRVNTGGTLMGTWTSGSTTVSVPYNFGTQFPGSGTLVYYYLVATCINAAGDESLPVTSSQICTMIGYSGANQTWTSPYTGTVSICLSGGGAGGTYNQGSGGHGGLVVATYAVTNGTGYTVAVGGGGGFGGGQTATWGGINGASSGGAGFNAGGGGSQFQTLMYAGGGGGCGVSTNICDSGNAGTGGNGGGTSGVAGGSGLNFAPFSLGGGAGTASAAGAGGAGGGGGSTGAAGSTGNGGAGGAGATTQGSGGGGGYRGGGGSGGLAGGRGPTGGGGGGSSFSTGVTLLQNTAGGALTGIIDTRFGDRGLNGCCAIFW